MTHRGIGLAASVAPETILQTARMAEALSFGSFWLNNPPGGHALALLGTVADATPVISLGVGVIPLSHQPADVIAADVERAAIPAQRLLLGVGSGAGGGGIERVRAGVAALRQIVDVNIVVAALGPRMCRLAGEVADGVLLNWTTPEWAGTSLQWVRDGAETAGRQMPRTFAYVRVALRDEGASRLGQEAATYESYPHYAAHFGRMGTNATATALHGDTGEIALGAARWDGVVDDVVFRIVTANDTTDEIRRVVEALEP